MTTEAGKHIGNGLCWLGFWFFSIFAFCDMDVTVRVLPPEVKSSEYKAAEKIGQQVTEILK